MTDHRSKYEKIKALADHHNTEPNVRKRAKEALKKLKQTTINIKSDDGFVDIHDLMNELKSKGLA